MAHLKEVVDRINLIAFTQQITKAMKMVSASKLHKIQQVLLPLKAYTTQYNRLLYTALQNIDGADLVHCLTKQKTGRRLLLIVVASNRGLCGAFNKNVLKAAYEQLTKQEASTTVEVLVIGKKAYQFFKKSTIPVIDAYVDLLEKAGDKADDQASAALTTYCIEAFKQNKYTEIALAYTAFKNAAKQEVVVVPFLPFSPHIAEDCSPTRPLYHMYEPSRQLLIAQLIPKILQHKIMHMLVESSASEHAARMATMSQATDNADELLKVLRISYNRTRQALITSSLAEITSGAEALAEA
ncbi:MAG: ATP synthase F1 subunit gamma [Candidatus Cardinium sp.]|uniref:ATP synthase F1 subunit gamma n=1 Tax=Cardinium endosymbiont of Dermatophagoides farinae TaxID=2597823 RepID=UPI00118299FF|nr:ATP synthase F1 subunit gamma [Cardinium endosymbiont of Dermatophagoides farinae]TSJ80839.1 ATP synthase F1 subunit gamma [Cardinium endosymbiont of Dermatophagoides farinae]UWW96844.1 MAG: ATP synthase F1 subunit gamma [Candidatus Cardinium sp.]